MRLTDNQINPQHLTTRGHQIRNDDHQQLDTQQHRTAEAQPLADVGGVKEERQDCDEPCRGARTMCTRGWERVCCGSMREWCAQHIKVNRMPGTMITSA
jgi:hypothetical protein